MFLDIVVYKFLNIKTMNYTTEKTKKFQSLPKITSLQLQLNMGKVDYRNGKISIEELSQLQHKLEYFLSTNKSL